MKLLPPAQLFATYQHFLIEEALATIRHDTRNKLAVIRNAAFYVGRRLQKQAPQVGAEDPRVPDFLTQIGQECGAAEVLLRSHLPAVDNVPLVEPAAVLERLVDLVALPPRVRVVTELAGGARVRAGADELAVGLFCLLENAVDALAEGGVVVLRAGVREQRVFVEVEDDGPGLAEGGSARAFEAFFTTRPGRLGLGLNVAQRVAGRAKGRLELAGVPSGRGVNAILSLPVEA